MIGYTEEEKINISREYRNILRLSKERRKPYDHKKIRMAFELAVEAHKDMRRKSGEAYIFHPITVAKIAASEIGLGTTSIICALLHDVVEDTKYTIEDIEERFGSKIAKIIDGLTKMSGVFDGSGSPQAENFRKMLLTMADDVRVILIKLCDRLHNMRTLEFMSAKNQHKIASETEFIYAPLAHRLGLYSIKSELEDLSLKYNNPEEYQFIKEKLQETKEQRQRYIREFIKPIKESLDNYGIKFEIKGRLKSIYSISKKIKKQNIAFEDIYDLFAIRIIIDVPQVKEILECWTVYTIVSSVYTPNQERLKDWVSQPKSNGYQSLHTTVMGPKGKWFEVQIRSKRMDEIAEKGVAAHWKYKESKEGMTKDEEWFNTIREILEKPTENAIDFLDNFKMGLYSDEVYIFTPKGDLKKLPLGATALDFAFEIHSEIGRGCLSAKVNKKLEPLSYVLKNGDQVEIISSSKPNINKDWLSFAQTAKARSKIKQFLNEDRKQKNALGKEILERKFRNSGVAFNAKNIKIVFQHFGLRSEGDLYFQIYNDSIKKEKLKLKSIIENAEKPIPQSKIEQPLHETKEKTKAPKTKEVIIGESDVDLAYSLAECCKPIPGDDIIGFTAIGKGLRIHRTNCPNAVRLMSKYGYRILKAYWADDPNAELQPFEVELKLNGIDSLGLVSQITETISKDLKTNMKQISFKALDGAFEGNILAEVKNKDHLNTLISKLKNINEFLNIQRIEND